jgi:hypothetical protein
MGWEKRGNQSYYYHKKRKSGQTVSTYAGRGVLAQLQVQILEDEQRVRQAAYSSRTGKWTGSWLLQKRLFVC